LGAATFFLLFVLILVSAADVKRQVVPAPKARAIADIARLRNPQPPQPARKPFPSGHCTNAAVVF